MHLSRTKRSARAHHRFMFSKYRQGHAGNMKHWLFQNQTVLFFYELHIPDDKTLNRTCIDSTGMIAFDNSILCIFAI